MFQNIILLFKAFLGEHDNEQYYKAFFRFHFNLQNMTLNKRYVVFYIINKNIMYNYIYHFLVKNFYFEYVQKITLCNGNKNITIDRHLQ